MLSIIYPHVLYLCVKIYVIFYSYWQESPVFISEEAGSQSSESTGPTSKKLTVEIQVSLITCLVNNQTSFIYMLTAMLILYI